VSLYQLQMDGHWELCEEPEPTRLPPMTAAQEQAFPNRPKRNSSVRFADGLVWVRQGAGEVWLSLGEYAQARAWQRDRRGLSRIRVV
jgi:hypothetical protein